MSCFIGIQIPPELRGTITDFRRAHQYVSIEPHIKLISPRLLENTAIVQQKLESFCLSQSEFRLVVAGPACFNNRILYLTILPGAIHLVRDRLARRLEVDMRDIYRPHLTVIRQHTGQGMDLTCYLDEMRQTFRETFAFDVSQLTLFTQQTKESPYLPTLNVPFTGRSG